MEPMEQTILMIWLLLLQAPHITGLGVRSQWIDVGFGIGYQSSETRLCNAFIKTTLVNFDIVSCLVDDFFQRKLRSVHQTMEYDDPADEIIVPKFLISAIRFYFIYIFLFYYLSTINPLDLTNIQSGLHQLNILFL